MEHFYQTIDGYFDFQDIYAAAVLEAKDNDILIEVGAWKGKSAAFMAVEIVNSGKKIRFDVVDTWTGTPDNESAQKEVTENGGTMLNLFLENMKPVAGRFIPTVSTSVQAANLYQDHSVNFVFIDADHSIEAVNNDLNAWLPKIKPGHVIAGHDYVREIKETVDAFFKDKYPVQHIGDSWLVRTNS